MDYDEMVQRIEAESRIDYLKFIFKTDAQEWQERYWPTLVHIEAYLAQNGHKGYKITPLGQGVDGLRRYCVEFWGTAASNAAGMVPHSWYNCMYRADYREEVPSIESADIQAVQAFVSVRPSGRTGTSTFSTPPAKKTNQRDVGGKGVRFGSRKSDQHAVLYKRGAERTAWEFRLQGKAALAVGRRIASNVELQLGYQNRDALMVELRYASMLFLEKIASATEPAQLMQWADEARGHMPSLFDGVDDGESEAADAWWESLSEDEQIEWQRSQFDTTPKGRKA